MQKIIACAGIASRRAAERMILEGRISVNNEVVRQLGAKADRERDEIRVDGKLVHATGEKIYLVLNKPRGFVTTLRDPQRRPIVTDLLPAELGRVFPVGRLDYDSEGLLFLTNDGDLAQRILHPRFRIPKLYKVKIKGRLSSSELQHLREGLDLSDGRFCPDDIRVLKVNEKSTWLMMGLRSGKNRIIRRAFNSLDHDVTELIRTHIGGLGLGDLKIGEFRLLTKRETEKMFPARKQDKVKNFLD